MQSGHDHDNRRFHKGHERHNNTPPEEGVELRGRRRTPGDIERGLEPPVRPGGESIERGKPSPARPREGEDEVTGEPRERRGESIER